MHYLNPIRRNSKHIDTYNLYEYDGVLTEFTGITYKKIETKSKTKWLYSFRDATQAFAEEQSYLEITKKNASYNSENYKKKQKEFGTIILESDIDMPVEVAYKAYAQRWQIELVMRYYKQACEFEDTRVHDDYSVIGSEFCDFLSTILTFRIIKAFDKADILKKMPYKKAMSILKRAKKIRIKGDTWQLIKLNKSNIDMLCNLKLLQLEEKPKRKRGRPRK